MAWRVGWRLPLPRQATGGRRPSVSVETYIGHAQSVSLTSSDDTHATVKCCVSSSQHTCHQESRSNVTDTPKSNFLDFAFYYEAAGIV